ncbi:MAG: acetyl-CoA carboxylase biotin carboxyl carrier protein subunit [Flavobacteriales bacterium]|nr:acetyl-CoA carboxylase biotin carboxyl carrier protein subunit [Flavobacteriales bacterium]
MYKAVFGDKSFKIEFAKGEVNSGKLNDVSFELDIDNENKSRFHIIRNNKTYTADVLKANYETKTFTIKVNGSKYEIEVKDRMDELLKEMGMEGAAEQKITDIKAPMPGLVLDILVELGQVVSKGEAVLILEAMRMENIIKSPADGTVKSIDINKGNAVEKNEILVNFE